MNFCGISGRSGWRHLYHYRADGKLLDQLTKGKWEVKNLYTADLQKTKIYFAATKEGATELHTYCLDLKNKKMGRLTRQAGTNHSVFNPQGNCYINYWSNFENPKEARVYQVDGTELVPVCVNSSQILNNYKLGAGKVFESKDPRWFSDGGLNDSALPDFKPCPEVSSPMLCLWRT